MKPNNVRILLAPLAGMLISLLIPFFLSSGTSMAYYSTSQIDNMLLGGVGQAAAYDNQCWQDMHYAYYNTYARDTTFWRNRDAVDTGAYKGQSWISQAGAGANTTITVPYGTTQVPLQYNAFTFLCSSVVNPDGKGAAYPELSSYGVVTDSNNANDQAPVSNPTSENYPSMTENRYKVTATSVSGGGSISLYNGSITDWGRNPTSRYWFGATGFNYYSPGPITHDETIQIAVTGIQMSQYSHTTVECSINGHIDRNGWTYNCPSTTSVFTINFHIANNYTLSPNVKGSIANGAGVAINSQLKVDPYIYNLGPTPSLTANWQLFSATIPPGGRIPAGGSPSNLSPTQYYGPGWSAVSGANGTMVSFPLGNTYVPSSGEMVTIPSDPIGTHICYALSVQPYTQSSSNWMNSTPYCVVIGKSPKIQIWGGNLTVRGSIITSMTTSVVGASTKVFGSWGEYGVVSSGENNTPIASNSGLVGGSIDQNAHDWSKLTFANSSQSGKYGYFTSIASPPALVAKYGVAASASLKSNSVDVSSVSSGIYKATDLTIKGGTLSKGNTIIIYATGTVTITGDINYTNAQLQSVTDIPQLLIIAKDINITSAVKNIDGWLVTTGTASTDGINDCSDAPSQLTSSTCNQKLTVNGPVITTNIKLLRTAGSDDPSSEDSPAEVFNLRADAILWAYQQASQDGKAMTIYTTELPPRF